MDPQKIEKVTGHRFEGYTVEMLAMEIDMFRSGAGVGSMTAAVDALKALGQSLAETDAALRDELGKLGIAWNSETSGLAQAVFEDRAAFAQEAEAKVNNSAQAAFVLSEAFTTLLNKLPDAQTLRDGAKSLSVGDLLANLIGHETDHAAKVRAANAARDQAIDALNEFKSTCATELAGIDPLGPPETILLDESTGPDPRRTGSDGGFDTMAAAPFEVGRGSGGTTSPMSAGTGTGGGGAECPSTSSASGGGAAAGGSRSTGSAAAPSGGSTEREPSASDTVAGGAAGAVVGAGAAVVAPRGRSGDPAPGRTPPTAPSAVQPPASGGAVPAWPRPAGAMGAKPGTQGGHGSAGGGAVPPGASPGGHGGVAGSAPRGEALAAGKLSGVTPPAPSPGAPVGHGAGPQASPLGASAGVAGGAAAAAGAAGVAGAMSGEQDRERRPRGYGQDTEVDGKPLHDFEVGEISGERAARNVERIEPRTGEDRPQYLEPAATQESAGEHSRVRSHGVDDVDLFSDQRMVAPEVIGDDPSSAYREDRKGSSQ